MHLRSFRERATRRAGLFEFPDVDVFSSNRLRGVLFPNRLRGESFPPIGNAAIQGNLEGVRAAMRDQEGSWDEGDFFEGMVHASALGHAEIVQEILNWQASELAGMEPLPHSCSPLVHAASRGHEDVVRLLLASGVNASEVDFWCWRPGSTALIEAAGHGYAGIVEGLLSTGAHVNFEREDGSTALSAAAQNGHAHVVDILLAQCNNTESTRMTLERALRSAVEGNHLDIVIRLLSAGSCCTRCNRTTVCCAGGASAECSDGDSWRSVGRHGYRVLINLAAANGTADILRELVKHGANVNELSRGMDNMTPLIIACQKENEDAVRVLIECGANVSHTRHRRHPYSALLATDQGSIVRLLLQAGADPNQVPKPAALNPKP